MSVIKRYQETIKGALSITGNTLGLAGDINGEGVLNFTTASPAPPSGGTTTTWQNNSSAAFLVLPTDAKVTYAELTWGAQVNGSISGSLNTTVTFTTPLGANSVSPDPLTSQTITTQVGETFYLRSQNVTDLVKNGGAGEYILGGVPGIRSGGNAYVGWSLIVAYSSSPLQYRNITVWSLFQHIQGSFGNVTVPISGFATPATGAVTGRLVVSAGGGNPQISGDFMRFGPPSGTLVTLSGPNNGATNFFASQINNNAGLLDTTGTWGTRNAVPPSRATIGDRNSFDITNVSVNGGLTNNQTSADIVFGTVSDTYDAMALGIQIDVNAPLLTPILKTVDKPFADIGDTVTYTITFQNRGLIAADDAMFMDTLPNGLTFIPNSLNINGTPSSGNPNPPGVSLGSIAPDQRVTISFKGIINTLPNPNPMVNVSDIAYNFLPGVGLATIPADETSNNATTQVNNAYLTSSKQVNKAFADVLDTITYTIVLTNSGNAAARNVVFIDTIPSGTTLVPGSFKQDGTAVTGSPNTPGVTLPNVINGKSTSTVTFSVVVNQIPTPNPIPNNANAKYSYIVDPSIPVTASSITNTNTVFTQINNADLSNITKAVDKSFASIFDVLTYTITIPNKGNVSANNVTFIDTIPNGTTFVPNSVFINGVQQNGFTVSPPNGVNLGTINPNNTLTLTFQVTVNTIPTPNPIPNSGVVNYNYIVDPSLGTTGSRSNNTNIVTTTINDAVINSTKIVTPTNGVIGSTLFYTVILTNSGNATANNVVFKDTIPNDTTFVPNSFAINGTTQTGANPSPPVGVTIPNIGPNGSVTVTFRVTVDTIPTPNPIPNSSTTTYTFVANSTTGTTIAGGSNSNTVSTFINPQSNPLKIVDKQFAKVGDILNYTVRWINNLSTQVTDLVFLDTIPNDTTFISDSVTLNGVTISGATVAPPNGLSIGTIPVGVITTVTFRVLVNTLPNPNPIPNQAIGRYNFISDPTLGTVTTQTTPSNIVTTQVNTASIPSATKSVDKTLATVGSTLNYTVSFTNTGNVTANNIVLIDTIPDGGEFIINSVNVNGSNQPGAVVAPPTGLSIGSLGVNQTATVTFAISVITVPNPNPMPNNAFVSYDYIVDPVVQNTGSGATNTNNVFTQINIPNLNNATKAVDKAFANVGDILTYTITLPNTGNTTANNVIITDTIPTGTSFQLQSVVINNTPNTSTVPVGNVLVLNVGNIAPSAVTTLVFKVKVDTVPSNNLILNNANAKFTFTIDASTPNSNSGSVNTNTVNTSVNVANIGGIFKFVDKAFVSCGELLTYTISLPNNGNITATNVVLHDTVPNGTVFVPNSILVNGVASGATSPTSIPVGTINPGATSTVSFSVRVQC